VSADARGQEGETSRGFLGRWASCHMHYPHGRHSRNGTAGSRDRLARAYPPAPVLAHTATGNAIHHELSRADPLVLYRIVAYNTINLDDPLSKGGSRNALDGGMLRRHFDEEKAAVTISDDLLEMIRCPRTRQPLKLADQATLERVNQAIAAGRLRNALGKPVTENLVAALVTDDGATLYAIVDDIPILLADEAVSLDQLDAPEKTSD